MEPQVEEITRDALPAALPRIQKLLEECSFVSMDCEMGGLSLPGQAAHLMDTVEERYSKFRQASENFPLLQFGLSFFKWDSKAKQFHATTLQFPLFPRFEKLEKQTLAHRQFSIQSMSLQYVRDHGFDLNHWIDNGIGHLSHAEQELYKDILTTPTQPTSLLTKFQDTEDLVVTDDVRKRIEMIVKEAKKLFSKVPPTSKEVDMTAFLTSPVTSSSGQTSPNLLPAYVTSRLAPFRREALVRKLKEQIPSALALDCSIDNANEEDQKREWERRVRIVNTSSKSQKEALLKAHEDVLAQELWKRNQHFIGFTCVFDLLTKASIRKPLVGHNMMLDLVHCYTKFHQPPPLSCSDFLQAVPAWLTDRSVDDAADASDPMCIFDTKHLVSVAMEKKHLFQENLNHTALEYLFEQMMKPPFTGPKVVYPKAEEGAVKTSAHQAGYDAFMTGCLFLRVTSGLGLSNQEIGSIATKGLDQHRNVLFVSHMLPPTTIRLHGQAHGPSRRCIIQVDVSRAGKHRKLLHVRKCIEASLQLKHSKHMEVHYGGSRDTMYVRLPREDLVDRLIDLRRAAEPCYGEENEPIPNIGCMDLYRCEPEEHKRKKAKLEI